jgi:hypothetical protein
VTPASDKETVQLLRAELGSVEISPAPVLAVVQRGKAIKARRRVAGLGAVAAVAAVLVAANIATRPGPPPGTVTVNPANPRAPGGVFASGTADGRPWTLAVRNIDDPGSHRCRAAVMLNGHDGDVLFPLSLSEPSFGTPAILGTIPGLRAVGAMFTQVTPEVTRAVISFGRGDPLTVRPVQLRACGHLFRMVGLLYSARRGLAGLATTSKLGPDESLVLGKFSGGSITGVWLNLDKSARDIASSQAATLLGAGSVEGLPWRITASLGLFGQCFTATLLGDSWTVIDPANGKLIPRRSGACGPVTLPPRTFDLSYLPIPGPQVQFTAYAGLVSPRTARATVTLSDGKRLAVTPVTVTGRTYLAFEVPPDYWVTRLSLADSAGRVFASITRMPPPGSPPDGPVPTFAASSGVVPAGPALRVRPGGVPG